MAAVSNDRGGKLVLRLVLGVVILLHGIAKLKGGVTGITGMVAAQGLPAWLGYAVLIGEVLAPLMLILGFYARIGGALIAINMIVALYLVHRHELFSLGPQGGWAIELQAMLLFSAIAVALMGPGRPGINDR
jgi:putative oxidoreductase